MTDVAQTGTIKSTKYVPNAHISVSRNMPFVGDSRSSKIPFVAIFAPNSLIKSTVREIHGFTLIELMVTIAVAAILVVVAVPNLRTFVQNSRINTQVNDLIADLSYARSEAIKRRTNVAVCQSTNGTTCAGGNWKDGRLIYADINGNGALDAGEVVLRFRGAPGGSDNTLTTTPAGADPIVFNLSGQFAGVGGTSFAICDDRGFSKGKSVTLNSIGQTVVGQPGAC
jgi:type IV fimbrial biogenesis protein FimT